MRGGRSQVAGGSRGGFTLLETVIALGIVAAVALGIAGGMRAAQLSSRGAEASRIALEAAQAEIERTKALTVYDALQRAGPDHRWSFDVPGLDGPARGVAPGQVRLLSEREAAELLQQPRLELNFNGVPDENAIDGSYRVLLFEVRVDWRSPAGVESLRLVGSTTDGVW